VLLDVPMDVFSQHIAAPAQEMSSRRPAYGRPAGSPDGIADAVQLLQSARSPAIFAGNGAVLSEATPELKALAELLAMPVATTLMGKGVFPEDHPLACGMSGIWGTRVANETMRSADVIVAIGTAFGEADCSSWRPEHTFAIPPTRLIQIDVDPQEIGKIYPVEIGIVGDAKTVLRQLIDGLRGFAPRADEMERRVKTVDKRRTSWNAELAATKRDNGTPIHPARLLDEIAKAAPRDAIYVTDVGWNKNGAGQQLYSYLPQTFITSGALATMGFAPAAAIGAKIGAPDRTVICLVGDGGFLSVCGALTTAVELGVPVVWVIFNNYCFSTIRTVGTTYFSNAYGTEFRTPDGEPYNPDFPMLARAFGVESARVESPDALPAALKTALAANKPYLLEVVTRGDVPMPRTGYWDIADFLAHGND
jgi:acetolactate synthase-1/2/3 large subunit